MRKKSIVILTSLVLLGAGSSQVLSQEQAQVQQQEQVYGWQLMSERERQQYQQKMRAMTSPQEREAFRIQHHQMMQERARQQGVTLPEQPGAGPGMGPGRQGTPGKNQGQGKKNKRPGKGSG